jgi:aminobenzoyl-glutamate transport protein
MIDANPSPKGLMQRILDVVEKVGNLVPHPVLIFVSLILIVIVLSQVMAMTGVGVTYEEIVPKPGNSNSTEIAQGSMNDTGDHGGLQAA